MQLGALVSDFEYPDDLRYTAAHEWVRPAGDVVRVGITAFAQDALGDIVFVTLPEEGEEVQAGSACGEVESTKSVSDIYAPVSGTVAGRNPALDATPELVNSDPYGEGWMFEIRPADPDAVDGLLSAADYQAQLG
jgi:glycine cleavage system H protein